MKRCRQGGVESAGNTAVARWGFGKAEGSETGAVHSASAPAGLQREASGYFLAIAMLDAPTKRRFTSSQLMFRMNAST